MDADGGHVQRILSQTGSEFSAAFSPNGRSLAYGTFAGGSNRQLALLDLETGQSSWLLDDRGNDDTPVFSPDGQWLAFTSYPEIGNSEIYVLRRDCVGTRAACTRRLTNSPYMDIYPRWRPG
jgi:Tol biopolymer transport system component